MANCPHLTAEYLRSILNYDPPTGVFTWAAPRPKVRVGQQAGFVDKKGFVVITIDGVGYFAHRLAWLYVHGAWPAQQLDHRDIDRANNRITNLRDATNGQNCANRRSWAKSGLKGVCARKNRWLAQIRHEGRVMHLGSFKTAEEAHRAYIDAALRLHGQFARSA